MLTPDDDDRFYSTCFQITVSGGGSATPPTVLFPGAYKASDAGIQVNIHAALSGYTAPGPAVYAGGSTKKAGSACTGCESTCKPGSGPVGTATAAPAPQPTTTAGNASPTTTPGNGNGGGGGGCTVQAYGQCGGNGYTGCTKCAVSLSEKGGRVIPRRRRRRRTRLLTQVSLSSRAPARS